MKAIFLIFLIFSFYYLLFIVVLFFVCRSLGVKIEKAYLYFDPWFELYKIKIGETDFGIGWLPLGSYLKIAGMKTSVDEVIMPYDFNKLPPLVQVLIMASAPVACLVVGLLLYGGLYEFNPSYIFPMLFQLSVAIISLIFIFGAINYFTPKNEKPKISKIQKLIYITLIMSLYLTSFLVFFHYLENFVPWYKHISKLLSGGYKIYDIIEGFSQKRGLSIAAYLGIDFFFVNLLPIGGMNGFKIVEVLYLFLTKKSLPEKFVDIYTFITLTIFIIMCVWVLVMLFL